MSAQSDLNYLMGLLDTRTRWVLKSQRGIESFEDLRTAWADPQFRDEKGLLSLSNFGRVSLRALKAFAAAHIENQPPKAPTPSDPVTGRLVTQTTRKCGNCMWWNKHPAYEHEGECRGGPPHPSDNRVGHVWPRTHTASVGCGSFRLREGLDPVLEMDGRTG